MWLIVLQIYCHFVHIQCKFAYEARISIKHLLLVALRVVVKLGQFEGTTLRLGQDTEAPSVEGDLLSHVPRVSLVHYTRVSMAIGHEDAMNADAGPHGQSRLLLALKTRDKHHDSVTTLYTGKYSCCVRHLSLALFADNHLHANIVTQNTKTLLLPCMKSIQLLNMSLYRHKNVVLWLRGAWEMLAT